MGSIIYDKMYTNDGYGESYGVKEHAGYVFGHKIHHNVGVVYCAPCARQNIMVIISQDIRGHYVANFSLKLVPEGGSLRALLVYYTASSWRHIV